jgi:hypothetical protein
MAINTTSPPGENADSDANGIDQRIDLGNVVPVCRARDDSCVDDQVVLLPSLWWPVGSGRVYPAAQRESTNCLVSSLNGNAGPAL